MNKSGNPGYIHPGASSLLGGEVFIKKEGCRGECSLLHCLTDSLELEEDQP